MGGVELKINGGWRDADGPPLDAVALKVPGGQHLCLARGNNQQHTDKQHRGQYIKIYLYSYSSLKIVFVTLWTLNNS